MTRKNTKFCFSWPNETLEISGRLRNIAIFLSGRTLTSQSNFILPAFLPDVTSLFVRRSKHKKSARPLPKTYLDTKKAIPNIGVCPESLGVTLE